MNTIKLRKFYPLQMYVLENLNNQKLTCSNPKVFNDPFDCKLLEDESFILGLTPEQQNLIRQMHVLCTFKVDEKMDLISFYKIQRYFWSFYGDAHKGICIEFELPIKENATDKDGIFSFMETSGDFNEKTDSFFSGKTEYKSDYLKNLNTVINNTKRDSFSDVLKNIGFNKDDAFEKEDEYRIINLGNKENINYSFFDISNYGKRIIFGNRCNTGVRNLVKTALEKKYDSFYFVNNKLEEEEDV